MLARLGPSRGIVLRKVRGLFAGLFQYAGVRMTTAASTGPALAGPPVALSLLLVVGILALLALAALLDGALPAAVLATPAAVLVTKNREANEFKARANAIRAELADAKKEFTADEVVKRTEEIKTLLLRAQEAAAFTPEGEIERQGGDEGLTRIDRHTLEGEEGERADFRTIKDRTAIVRRMAASHFSSFGAFLRATVKGPKTEREAEGLRAMIEFTRAITGDGSAEVLLPLQQEQSIFSISNDQPGLLQLGRRYSVAGRTLRIPVLVQDEGTNTLNRPMAGKIANVTIVGEAQEKPAREPVFTQRVLTMFKYAAVTEFGDEILADDFTGELPGEVTTAVGGQVVNKLNEDVTIDGGGTTEPVGALNDANTALLAVNRAVANQVSAADAFAMYERHTHGPGSSWLISRRVLAPLMAMTNTNNGLVTWLTNLRDRPQMLLLGLPVIISDLLPSLGSKGDVALVNGDFYATGLRQALTVESSIHRKFEFDITMYRFLARGGGIPIPTGTYAYKFAGGVKIDEHSPFVVLDVPSSS